MTGRKQVGLGLLVGMVAIGLVTLLRGCIVISEPDPGPMRSVYPAGTETPAGYVPGLVLVRGMYAGLTTTPMPGQVAYDIPQNWDEIQPNLTATPNWNTMKTRVAYADSLGMSSWIGIAYFVADWGADPDIVSVPDGVPTVTYTGGCGTEYAPAYGNTTFRNAYATVVASMMDEFGDDARVSGFVVASGVSGEVIITYDQGCNNMAALEAVVPCSDFMAYVIGAAQAHRDGTDKPLTLASNVSACKASSYNADRKVIAYLVQRLNLTPSPPEYIGNRYNGLYPDDLRAWMYGTPVPWGRMQSGATYPEYGGVYYEPGGSYGFPTLVPTAVREGHTDYMLLNAANAHADNVFLQEQWWAYVDDRVLDVITQTLGTTTDDAPMAWVWFREAEYGRQNVGTGYEYSGVPGPFTHLASVVGSATPTTYCSPHVKATADALGGVAPPDACQSALSTPAARESRNALGYAASATVGIDIDDGWVYGGLVNSTYSVTLRYLDDGTGTITLAYENMAGVESTQTITKTDSAGWMTAGFTMTAALANGFTTHDVELRTAGDESILNSLTILYTTAVATPTPSPTPTGTPVPTSTPTRTPTATNTPVPSVYLNEVCPNTTAAQDTNGDGQMDQQDRFVELYSGSAANVDLDGWSLVIGSETYEIPQTSLVASSYKVIYGWDITIPVTGTVTLYSPLDVAVDAVTWPAQSAGTCYARDPDGVDNWTSDMVMTLGAAN